MRNRGASWNGFILVLVLHLSSLLLASDRQIYKTLDAPDSSVLSTPIVAKQDRSHVGQALSAKYSAYSLTSALISIGDRVQTNGTVNVRQTPAGSVLGTQSLGRQGTVIGGPTVASLSGTSYTWFDINFDSGVDGWVADIGLVLVQCDIVVQSTPTISPNPVTAGNTITVGYIIHNNGPGNAGTSQTKIQIKSSSGTQIAAATFSAPAINASANSPSQSNSVTIPAGTPAGTFTAYVILDNLSQLNQSNTANDLTPGVNFTITAPVQQCDIVVQGTPTISPNPVTPGNSINISYVIRNNGPASAGTSQSKIQIKNSAGAVITSLTFSAPAINAGANSSTQINSLPISSSIPAGIYTAFVILDNLSQLNQSNTANDLTPGVNFTVNAPVPQLPNLVPQNITLNNNSVQAGNTLNISWTLTNIGSGNSPNTVTGVRLTQSSVSGNAQPYTSFPNVSMPTLNANSSTPQSTQISIPLLTTPGTYYIWIIADNVANSSLQQSNYADDYARSSALTVTITQQSNLSVTPASPPTQPSSAGTLMLNVQNTGGGAMNYSASVMSGSSWLSITSGSSGGNSGTIRISYTANNEAQRSGTIRVTASGAASSPATITVRQAASGAGCAYALDYPYPSADYNLPDPWQFFYRECTSYVAWKMNREAGTTSAPYFFSNYMRGGHFGNAATWATNAAAIGFVVDSNPSVGAIAHWGSNDGLGALGHVAYVEGVNPDGSVNLSEFNFHADHNYNLRCNVTNVPRFIHINATSSSVNPSAANIAAKIQTLAQQYQIPAIVLAAVAWKESEWRQFDINGNPLTGPTGDVGMMQINVSHPALPFDAQRVRSDWAYNMDIGCQILKSKFNIYGQDSASQYDSAYDEDSSILENWYYPIAWYNGSGSAAYTYVKTVWGNLKSLPFPLSAYFIGTPELGDPATLNSFPMTIYTSVPYPPGSLDLATAMPSELISHGMYTLYILAQNGQKIHQWNWNTSTASNITSTIVGTTTAAQLQLVLDELGPEPNQIVALDSVLFLRDSFPVINGISLPNTGFDRNTRVIILVTNLQLAQSEPAASVVVNLVDSNNQSYDIAAEDVRPVGDFEFTQVIFRLPDNLSPGTCTIKVKAHEQVSNPGTMRIRL